jgi:putative salt-induced outer membrane protein YdiY
MNGLYATLGLAEDTWALNEGVIDEDAFLKQAWLLFDERKQQLWDVLDKTKKGFVTVVFDTSDRISHMFYRFTDPTHPALASQSEENKRLRNPSLLDFWSAYFDTGLSFTQGNSETRTFATAAKAQRKTQRDKITAYATSIFAENGTTGITEKTANAIRGGSRYELNVSDRVFTFGFVDLEFDEFQNLDLRNVLGGGVGWHVRKTDRTSFDVFGGGSYNQEFFSNDFTRRSAELVVGEEFEARLNDRLTFSQRLAFYPNMSDTGQYRVQFDSSMVTQLYRWIGWHISVSDRFLSNPIPGIKKNDLLLTTGLRFNVGRENLR